MRLENNFSTSTEQPKNSKNWKKISKKVTTSLAALYLSACSNAVKSPTIDTSNIDEWIKSSIVENKARTNAILESVETLHKPNKLELARITPEIKVVVNNEMTETWEVKYIDWKYILGLNEKIISNVSSNLKIDESIVKDYTLNNELWTIYYHNVSKNNPNILWDFDRNLWETAWDLLTFKWLLDKLDEDNIQNLIAYIYNIKKKIESDNSNYSLTNSLIKKSFKDAFGYELTNENLKKLYIQVKTIQRDGDINNDLLVIESDFRYFVENFELNFYDELAKKSNWISATQLASLNIFNDNSLNNYEIASLNNRY